jgi:hypothetical protein
MQRVSEGGKIYPASAPADFAIFLQSNVKQVRINGGIRINNQPLPHFSSEPMTGP